MRRFAAGLVISLLLTGASAMSQQNPAQDWPETAIKGSGINTKQFWKVMEDADSGQRMNILYRMYQRIRGVPENEIDGEISAPKARGMLIESLDETIDRQNAENDKPIRIASCYSRIDESLLGHEVLWGLFINRPDAGNAVITFDEGIPATVYKPLPFFSKHRPYIIPIVTKPENIKQLTDITVKLGFNDGQPVQIIHGSVVSEEGFFKIPVPSSICQTIRDSLRFTGFYNYGTTNVKEDQLTVRFKNRLIFPRLLDNQGNQLHAVTTIIDSKTVAFDLTTIGLSPGNHDIAAENIGATVPVTINIPQSDAVNEFPSVRNKITAIVAAPNMKWLVPTCLTCALNRFVLKTNPYALRLAKQGMLEIRLTQPINDIPVRNGGIVIYGPNYPKGLIFNKAASGSDASWLLKMALR